MKPFSNPSKSGGVLQAIWPRYLPGEPEVQHRKKVVVRNAQLAVVAMIIATVAGAWLTTVDGISPQRGLLLICAGIAYAFWCLYGMARPIRELLWGASDLLAQAPPVTRQILIYFLIQIGLAGLLFTLGNQGGTGALSWLVLLPPVAHAVILLPIPGGLIVGGMITTVLGANVVIQQGWQMLPRSIIAFSFAVFFTIIFTQLAVSAERSRNHTQALADELADACEKLKHYALQAEELAAVRERNRLAREIHDILGHSLTVVNVHLEAARAVQDHDPARAREAVVRAQELTQEGLREVRRSVAALRSSNLGDQCLPDRLKDLAAQARSSGLQVEFNIIGTPRTLSPPAEHSLYRAAQEGLTNVRRHAKTESADLTLDFSVNHKVRLQVEDHGMGSAEKEINKGFGLLGLRERASLLGGEVRTSSRIGEGFKLQFEVPS